MTDERAPYNLAHPVYLDVPMMISFLAHIDGGVTVSEAETSTESGMRDRLLKGKGGVRAKLWTLAATELEAEGTSQHRSESSTQSTSERHHTEASLFNDLYAFLHEDGAIHRIQDSNSLEAVRTGDLVELTAALYVGNPIEDLLSFFAAVLPYIIKPNPPAPNPAARPHKSGNPAIRSQAPASTKDTEDNSETLQLLLQMSQDIASAPVHDLLFETTNGLKAVVTVASEFFSSTTHEHLRQGEFSVIGKVTRVISGDSSVNLTRRTVLGVAGPELAQELISSTAETGGLSLGLADPIVVAPAVQVLPMAIFI